MKNKKTKKYKKYLAKKIFKALVKTKQKLFKKIKIIFLIEMKIRNKDL